MKTAIKFQTVEEYFSTLPSKTKSVLKEMRKLIKQVAPEAEETISYNIPAFKLNGMLVYYAAFKEHVSLFPTGSGIAAFKKELSKYEVSKGTVKFPLNEPLPASLITRIVKFRVKQNLEKAKSK